MLAALLAPRTGVGEAGLGVTLGDARLKAVAASARAALSEAALGDRGALASHRAAAFAALLALVRRRAVVAEVYDAMDAVADLAVTSLERADRTKASKTMLAFLLTYPMGKKRRKHHLGQLLRGLDYAYEEGRCAALDSLAAALRALPARDVEGHADAFFAALAARAANEDAAEALRRVRGTLATLLRRLSDDARG